MARRIPKANIIQPDGWATLDAAGLGRGIIAGWTPTIKGNLVAGADTPSAGAAATIVPSLGGRAELTTGAFPGGAVLLNNTNALAKIGTGDFTIAVVHVPASVTGTLVAFGQSGTSGVWLGDYSGAATFSIYGSLISQVASTTSVVGKVNVLMGTRIAGSARAYVNGKGGTAGAMAASIPAAGFYVGCFGNNGFAYVSKYVLAVIWNRGLSASEARAFAENPWQIFTPARRATFIGVNQVTGTIIAVDGCSIGTSLDSSYLASYFATLAISNAMASASSVQSSTAGVNAQGVSQASWNGLSASINGVDGASVAASASSVQTATILVLDANGSAVSCAISSVITQDVMVLSADGVTNGQALFQVNFSATAGVDGEAVGQATGIGEQSAIVNVSGSASATSAASAGAAIVLSSDGASESSSIVVGLGLGIFGADGAAGSAVGYATSSVDVQSIGAVSGSAIGHVAGDTFSGATATVSGTSRAHSVVTGQLAGVIGKDGRDVAVAVARAPKAIVLAKDARSESNSVTKAGRAGIGAATGRSESQAIARGDGNTSVTANYPVSMDMTTVPPDAWMVLVPLETTTAAVSVYGDDATVPQEVTTVTV